MKEIKDIAMWEETDSELAKYHIQQALNRIQNLKEQIKELFDEYLELKDRIDKAIEYIKTHSNCGGSVQEGNFIIEHIEEIYDGMKLIEILRGKDEK